MTGSFGSGRYLPSLVPYPDMLSRLTCLSRARGAAGLSTRPLFPSSKLLESIGLPGEDAHSHPASTKRFPDGGQYRIEIPSTEGYEAFKAVLEEGKRLKVPVHRVSQGSGIFLLPKPELLDMLRLGRDSRTEVCLFVGPRNAWDISATARTDGGRNIAGHRGADQLAAGLEDVRYAVELGLRSVLVADLGLLAVLGDLKKAGQLPNNLVIKVSVAIGPQNPASARLLEALGATTLNPPTDLTVAQLGAMRQATSAPIDTYVEAPDDLGGYVRHLEVPWLIHSVAPLYVKLGLRNSPNIYPSGTHIQGTAVALSKERLRRARITLDIIDRYIPEAVMSPVGAADLGIPE